LRSLALEHALHTHEIAMLCLRNQEIFLLLDHRPAFVNALLPTTGNTAPLKFMLCFLPIPSPRQFARNTFFFLDKYLWATGYAEGKFCCEYFLKLLSNPQFT
jgi:hypothetical protein